MKKDRLSFVIPAYNCQDTISESIESIFIDNFSFGDEVIVVDDASTDSTLEVLGKLKIKYPQIKILKHKINKGSAAAGRNTAIEQAENELIFCLDSDNILEPNSISNLKEYLIKSNADIAAFGEIHFFKRDVQNVEKIWFLFNEITILDNINCAKRTPCSSGNYLFTKESWLKSGRYNESIGGAYDSWAFGMKQLFHGFKMVTLSNTFYYHRYGYESTFILENRKLKPSLIVLQVLIPYLDLFNEKDVKYILNKGRYTWFEDIQNRKIRLKKSKSGLYQFLNNLINS